MSSYVSEMAEGSIEFLAGDETCTIRRLQTFVNARDGGVSVGLVTAANAAQGDVSVSVVDPSEGSGDLPSGLTVTIGGPRTSSPRRRRLTARALRSRWRSTRRSDRRSPPAPR